MLQVPEVSFTFPSAMWQSNAAPSRPPLLPRDIRGQCLTSCPPFPTPLTQWRASSLPLSRPLPLVNYVLSPFGDGNALRSQGWRITWVVRGQPGLDTELPFLLAQLV